MTRFGEYVKCPVCGRWGWEKTHKCPPVYFVRFADSEEREDLVGDDEWHTVRAESFSRAAEEYAQQFDYSVEYALSAVGTSIAVEVRSDLLGDGAATKVSVECGMSPVYHGTVEGVGNG